MTTMLEKMARAIARGHGCKMVYQDREGQMQTVASRAGYGRWGHSAGEYADRRWQEYIPAAEFALAALRNPTPKMLEAGPPEPYMDADAWARMIDAAMEDKP